MESHHLWNDGILPENDDDAITIHVVTLKTLLADFGLSHAKEFVEVKHDYIYVGVNREMINDEAISHALELVSELNTLIPGTMVEFGRLVHVYENKTFGNKQPN